MANDSNDITVAEFQKNSREKVRVGLSTFKNYRLLQIRSWATKDGADPIPTKSGIALQLQLIPELRKALDAAEEEARRLGWIKEGGAE